MKTLSPLPVMPVGDDGSRQRVNRTKRAAATGWGLAISSPDLISVKLSRGEVNAQRPSFSPVGKESVLPKRSAASAEIIHEIR